IDGLNYLGDDYVAIEDGSQGQVIAHALYSSAKFTDKTLEALPEIGEFSENIPSDDERKSVVYISRAFPGELRRRATLRAISVPRLSRHSSTKIVAVTTIKTLLAMLPTTVFQLPYTSHLLVPRLRQIVDRTPCYELRLGTDIRGSAEVI